MKKNLIFVICMMYGVFVQAQDIQGFVNRQLEVYPKSRLLDIYKSCFQDYMGAEHLVTDRQLVKAYLDEELLANSIDDLMPWYDEPCGIEGNYVRISIRTVLEGFITKEMLLDTFIRSANGKRPSVESWKNRWKTIVDIVDKMNLHLPHYPEDRAFIDSILAVGKYAISHSPDYRKAYRPHYRIVERSIYEHEIKPLIEANRMFVRIAEIEVYPQYLTDYLKAARNVGTESVRKESGVICIFPNQMNENENIFRIVEIYRNKAAYEHHLTTEHFQTYKQGTLHMVKKLKLVDVKPLDINTMPSIFIKLKP